PPALRSASYTLSLHDALPIFFEQAGEGTVFLAEVSELPPRGQEALLRLLERHEIVRLSSTTVIPSHARCIASTSTDLRARIPARSEEHTSELQSRFDLVCRLL